MTIGRSRSPAATSCRASSLAGPCRDRAMWMRPSTVASAIQTQAEFDVRFASSGQVVTAIGITRDMPGRRREDVASKPSPFGRGPWLPMSPRIRTVKAMLAKIKGTEARHSSVLSGVAAWRPASSRGGSSEPPARRAETVSGISQEFGGSRGWRAGKASRCSR
jgi:hypothetical protein